MKAVPLDGPVRLKRTCENKSALAPCAYLMWFGLPDFKPVSVPLRAAVIPLGRPLLNGSSDLPGSLAGRAVPPPLFGLAPRGVFPASRITPAAVRSYRTISPLPDIAARRYIFCGTFRRALRPARPLAGTLPCGDRTFLPRFRRRLPIRQPYLPYCPITGAPDGL